MHLRSRAGWEALLLAVRDYPAFDVFGSKLVNAAEPTVLDGAGDAYHVSGLVWHMGHGATVSSVAEQVREGFSLPVICATRAAACVFNLSS